MTHEITVNHGAGRDGIVLRKNERTLHIDHDLDGNVEVWTMDDDMEPDDGGFTTTFPTVLEGYLYLLNGHVAS